MKNETQGMRQEILSSLSLEAKLKILEGAYSGETCFLLTCGPSLNDIPRAALREFLANRLVIAVKQTYDLVQGITDFHLLNSWNITEFKYSEPKPIVLMERGPNDPEIPNIDWDLLFSVKGVDPQVPRDQRLAERLALRRNFDDFLFTRQPPRPWGPGIVYELGLYLAIHLGVRTLIMLGWDIGEKNTNQMSHFYDVKHPQVLNTPGEFYNDQSILNNFWGWFGKLMGRSTPSHSVGQFNKPGYYQDEVDLIASSTKDAYQWLNKKGVQLYIVSPISLASDEIPRISFSDLLRQG